MAAIPIGVVYAAMIASTAVAAVGTMRSAQAQSAASDYNAQLASQNAQIAEAQGNAAAEAQQRDAQRKIGTALATYGASGVETDSGSPADVLAASARDATLDNLTVKYNAKLRALSYQDQSGLDTSAAKNDISAGQIGATSALLSGASGAARFGYQGTGTPALNSDS